MESLISSGFLFWFDLDIFLSLQIVKIIYNKFEVTVMLKTFKLSAKNQTTVPTWVRKRLHVKSHQKIQYQPLGKNTVVMKAAKPNHYQNIFDQPGLTRHNFNQFMKSINMPNNNDLVGRERWSK